MTWIMNLAAVGAFAQQPIVYKPVADYYKSLAEQEELAKKERQRQREEDRKQEQERQQQKQQQSQALQQMMGALQGVGPGTAGSKGQRRRAADDQVRDGAQNTSTGRLESCGTVPAKVQQDLQEMMEFRKSCAAANKGAQQKFAISEYRGSLGQPTMYLFDANGNCAYKTAVSYGMGQTRGGTTAKAQACADKNAHFTPAGMHLTVPHPKGTNGYDESNSLGLAALEGQGSNARGILIHGSGSPGEGVSYGCSGVDSNCLGSVMKFLGYGALVFNSFDDDQASPGCRNTAGLKRSGTCQAEVAVSVADATPGQRGGGGTSGASGAAGAAR